MSKSIRLALSLSFLVSLFIVVSASAQATRTWVSGVGDDANPCSRTAPCKTFAGAISKTAAGGEISVLDPGGFGAVTITKAITIDGSATHASILHSATNGVVISLSTLTGGNTVILRDLSINGAGTGLNGVRILGSNATNVFIEDCDFARAQRAVDISPSVANFKVFMKNVDIRTMSDDAIESQPTAGQVVKLSLDNVRIRQSSLAGLHSVRDTNATVSNSLFQGNVDGIRLDNNTSHFNIVESVMSENSGVGLVNGGTAVTIIDGVSIFGNTTGILNNTGGQVLSFANSAIANNNADVTGTAVSSLPHP